MLILRHESIKALAKTSRAIDVYESSCPLKTATYIFNQEFYYEGFKNFSWFMISISLW